MIRQETIDFDGLSVPVRSLNTAVIGSGAAGLACAARLFRLMEETGVHRPQDQVAVVTHGMGTGTSHNAGSDKQTYYKLGTDAASPDTPAEFAATLTAGGCAHADLALVEGLNALRAFHHLVDAGVPFPHNARGGFVGYKTDHDPSQRATSAGPWTSRFMVRKLAAELKRYGVPVLEGLHVLAVLTEECGGRRAACGLLCIDLTAQDGAGTGLTLFRCRNVVAAGGGPGELYAISVYPRGQMGPYAALFEAGAAAENLTESQFGLASLDPRWNLSGTYQQVIPRYYSTDADGGNVREFLNPWFDSMAQLATAVFLKGYQWPFDPDKIAGHGSSLIDVLVQHETVNRGRRVFMDFRSNPAATDGLEAFDLGRLAPEARTYLERSGALQATPIERLAHMNQPSIDLYAEMGVDLRREPLEVGVCHQHCNGGFAVDTWWESGVPHLFVVGELAGTHGVKRPGGSALNAGQVGALRAAQRIAHVYHDAAPDADAFRKAAGKAVRRFAEEIARTRAGGGLDCAEVKRQVQRRMTEHAGMVRSLRGVRHALAEAQARWRAIRREGLRSAGGGPVEALQVRELALAQIGFLAAVEGLLARGGGSRGSHLVADPAGRQPHPKLGDEWRFVPENPSLRSEALEVAYDAESDEFRTRAVSLREAPAEEFWFENTWAEFRRGDVFARDEGDRPRPYR
ncbi:MAG: FAD-binding protein [Candidatus Brocadiaceae bacterium]|nr:FAD-binding protein [Candidatus Brocadiaceae bacterium]